MTQLSVYVKQMQYYQQIKANVSAKKATYLANQTLVYAQLKYNAAKVAQNAHMKLEIVKYAL